jgi:DNA-binding NarL/FixJ family response regulator
MTAPLQVIAVTFTPDSGFERRILDEVDSLQGRGVLRLLDMIFVAKTADGTLERLSIGDEADDEDFGSLLSGIIPTDPTDRPDTPDGNGWPGFDQDAAWALADSLVPGTAVAFLLVEHHWAASLFDAIAETGGALLGGGFLSGAAGHLVGAEVAAMEETARSIAEAQAIEGRDLLAAMAAGAEAVAVSEAIQSAAAAEAVRVLIVAGLVEEAAAYEAVSALATAGLVVEAADQATDEAVADDAATILAADEATAQAVAEDAAIIAAADEVAEQATEEAFAKMQAASISVAEAQVLRYLPKPLSFSVIATKLGISRSAAKERAERLYKKMGVHNRADAVARARQLRLLRG